MRRKGWYSGFREGTPYRLDKGLRRPSERSPKRSQEGASRGVFERLNKQGMTTVELLVAMLIVVLILGGVPSLMHSINYYTRDAIVGVRNARNESAAIASLIKDVKSSENVLISPDGKTLTLQRSAGENGVSYAIVGDALYYNDDVLIPNVTSGVFGQDGTVVSATLNLKESEPIQLIMRRPSLKTLIDDGHAPIQPEFDTHGTTFTFNETTTVNSTAVKTISIPVVRDFECRLATVDSMAQILWYTVDEGDGVSPRQYVEGNKTVFETHGILKTVEIKVKVVAEDGISMAIYTLRLVPQGADTDRVPSWMWGGCEAFRMYMARDVFSLSSTANLPNVTFGQVRNLTSNLDFSLYNITEMGEIIGEFKRVPRIICTNSWIDHLPDSLCKNMNNLVALNLSGCTRLRDSCPDGSYALLRSNVADTAWKNTNCRNCVFTWP